MTRILLLASAFNSLTQRVHAELRHRGHPVAVELAVRDDDDRLTAAVRRHDPELVLAPMLTSAIPEPVWRAYPCLVVHPGPPGDRGPSALDRAVQERVPRWGVTVLQAVAAMDAGPVWAAADFAVPPDVGKSDLYRGELADAALTAVLAAVERFAAGGHVPADPPSHVWRPYLAQEERRIDWERDPTEAVLRKLRAADSRPGVLDAFLGGEWYLHGGRPEHRLTGPPGAPLATRAGALCRATRDGAVWIPELRARRTPGGPVPVKLPAAVALGDRLPPDVPDLPAYVPGLTQPYDSGGWSDITYEERGRTGFLRFGFPGGAMGADHCRRLLAAYRAARARPVEVLVLGGARDFFSNGIHLGLIEAAADPAAESLATIEAMDDLVEEILTTTDKLVVAALAGNAAAGGLMLALAADEVWCRSGSVLNPHYRLMGLYGSELWTYTLPRWVGARTAERLTARALPVTAACALSLGLVDRVLDCGPAQFAERVAGTAEHLATSADLAVRLGEKKAARERDEAVRPLRAYRAAELARMRAVFDDPAAPYHALRAAFVRKRPVRGTPDHLREDITRTACPNCR
ncbi:enoyl-CoA hydratase-related protein [Actinacidiphila acididurans]|uniref:Hydrogenase maturation protein n=1 Tax=Actinacidiphila acididurans TaxID=2784346 RepID=A0ABS2U3S1_9ACTN|nr:enoyl-CoA hydratase-related protein [Actinacidiphila acididurans]MBM9510253.1 hydrogenase maturation protein [Actinacidiphila acididurans]